MVKPEIAFKVKVCASEKYYYKVKIFKNSSLMQKYIDESSTHDEPCEDDVRGMCRNWCSYKKSKRNWVLQPNIGEIILNLEWLGSSVVAHECTHAMFHVMRVFNKRLLTRGEAELGGVLADGCDEEYLCDAVGDMTAQIYSKLRKAVVLEGAL